MIKLIKKLLRKGLNDKITYEIEHMGSIYGQDDYELGMYLNGEIVGIVKYVIFEGELTVSNILVRPEFRRKGFGSRMMQYLKQTYPDVTYKPSIKTDLGMAFKHKEIPGDLSTLDENDTQGIIVYHGSNSDIDNFKINSKDEGWFTDDYDYASQHGKVSDFILYPNKILTPETIKLINNDDIFNAIKINKAHITPEQFNKLLPRLQSRIDKYVNGDLDGRGIFEGIGGIDVLKALGFDMEKHKNPYDKNGDSNFYRVYNDKIIKKV